MKECKPEKMIELAELENFKNQLLKNTRTLETKIQTKMEEAEHTKSIVNKKVNEKFDYIVKILEEKKKNTLAAISVHCFQLSLLKQECENALGPLNESENLLDATNGYSNIEDRILNSLIKKMNKLEEFMTANSSKIEEPSNLKIYFDEEKRKVIENDIKDLCKVEMSSPLGCEKSDHESLLMQACSTGNVKMVEFLINNFNISINKTKDKNGYTPFLICLQKKHLSMCKLLLKKHKADMNIQDNTGKSPLIYSILTNNFQFAEYLILRCKANVHLRTIWNDTALHCAVENNSLRIVTCLIQFGNADLWARNSRGKLPLHLAQSREVRDFLQARMNESKQGNGAGAGAGGFTSAVESCVGNGGVNGSGSGSASVKNSGRSEAKMILENNSLSGREKKSYVQINNE